MKALGPREWGRASWILAAVAAAAAIAGFLIVSLSRIQYPFALEWMEGGSVDHVRRILSGQSIYVESTLDFVPFIYTPLYFYASAFIALLLGDGFLPLRLLSLLSTLASLAALFLLVHREVRDRIAALVASGLFAATFAASGAWFDLARVDSLFLALYAFSVVVLRRTASRGGLLLAGALLGLSILTKQTAVAAGLPLLLYALLVHGRRCVWFAGSIAAVVGTASLVFNLETRGWYFYYVLLPGQDVWDWKKAGQFLTHDLLAPLPVATIACVGLLVLFTRRRRRESLIFWGLLAAGVLAAAFVSRARSGGYLNVLMPLHWVLAAAFGVAIAEARKVEAGALSPNGWTPPGRFSLLAAAASLFQLALLAYDPRPQIPAEGDRAAGAEVVDLLKGASGEVFIPLHAYLAGMAGKRIYLQGNAGIDSLRAGDTRVRDMLVTNLDEAIREQRFDLIILDKSGLLSWNRLGPLIRGSLEASYEESGPVFESRKVFWPVTGARTRPEVIWRPRKSGPALRP